jgi:hypothetical protein
VLLDDAAGDGLAEVEDEPARGPERVQLADHDVVEVDSSEAAA